LLSTGANLATQKPLAHTADEVAAVTEAADQQVLATENLCFEQVTPASTDRGHSKKASLFTASMS
jgi:hypothetical protein